MNKVSLIGRLTVNPELGYTTNTNTAVCKFAIAVDRPKKNGDSQGADFIRITTYGRDAENCDRYLAKGRQVAVTGRLQTGSYKGRDGKTVYTTDVVADVGGVEFLSAGVGRQENRSHEAEKASDPAQDRQDQASKIDLPGASENDFGALRNTGDFGRFED